MGGGDKGGVVCGKRSGSIILLGKSFAMMSGQRDGEKSIRWGR